MFCCAAAYAFCCAGYEGDFAGEGGGHGGGDGGFCVGCCCGGGGVGLGGWVVGSRSDGFFDFVEDCEHCLLVKDLAVFSFCYYHEQRLLRTYTLFPDFDKY